MGTTAEQRAQIHLQYLDANEAGDFASVAELQGLMDDPEFSKESDPFAKYTKPVPEDFAFDRSGVKDMELRKEISFGDTLEEKSLRMQQVFQLVPHEDFTLSPGGELALTPSGLRKRGLETDGSGRNMTIEGEGLEVADIADITGYSPEAVGGTLGAVAGGALGTAATMVSGGLAAPSIPAFTAGGSALGAMVGKGLSEAKETISGKQLQSWDEVATDVALEGVISLAAEGVFPAMKGLVGGLKRGARGAGRLAKGRAGDILGERSETLAQQAIARSEAFVEAGGRPTAQSILEGQPIFALGVRAENIARIALGGPMDEANEAVVNREIGSILSGLEGLPREFHAEALGRIGEMEVKLSNIEGIAADRITAAKGRLTDLVGKESSEEMLGDSVRVGIGHGKAAQITVPAAKDFGAAWAASKGQKVVPTAPLKEAWNALKAEYPDEVAEQIAKQVAENTTFVGSIDSLAGRETVQKMHNLQVALRKSFKGTPLLKDIGERSSAMLDESFDVAFDSLPESLVLQPERVISEGRRAVPELGLPPVEIERIPAAMADMGAEREAVRLLRIAKDNYIERIKPFKDAVVRKIVKGRDESGFIVDDVVSTYLAKPEALRRVLKTIPASERAGVRTAAGRAWMKKQRANPRVADADGAIPMKGWNTIRKNFESLGDETQELFFPGKAFQLSKELKTLSTSSSPIEAMEQVAKEELTKLENIKAIKLLKAASPEDIESTVEDIARYYASPSNIGKVQSVIRALGSKSKAAEGLQKRLAVQIVEDGSLGAGISGSETFLANKLTKHVQNLGVERINTALGPQAQAFNALVGHIHAGFNYGPGGDLIASGQAARLMRNIGELAQLRILGKFVFGPGGRDLLIRLAKISSGVLDADAIPIVKRMLDVTNKILAEAPTGPTTALPSAIRQVGARAIEEQTE